MHKIELQAFTGDMKEDIMTYKMWVHQNWRKASMNWNTYSNCRHIVLVYSMALQICPGRSETIGSYWGLSIRLSNAISPCEEMIGKMPADMRDVKVTWLDRIVHSMTALMIYITVTAFLVVHQEPLGQPNSTKGEHCHKQQQIWAWRKQQWEHWCSIKT